MLKQAAATSEEQFQNTQLEITPFKEFAEKLELEIQQRDQEMNRSPRQDEDDEATNIDSQIPQ